MIEDPERAVPAHAPRRIGVPRPPHAGSRGRLPRRAEPCAAHRPPRPLCLRAVRRRLHEAHDLPRLRAAAALPPSAPMAPPSPTPRDWRPMLRLSGGACTTKARRSAQQEPSMSPPDPAHAAQAAPLRRRLPRPRHPVLRHLGRPADLPPATGQRLERQPAAGLDGLDGQRPHRPEEADRRSRKAQAQAPRTDRRPKRPSAKPSSAPSCR